MNATSMPRHAEMARPELGPLLSVLFLLIDDVRSLVLHVTSAGPGEGSTTVARDIAAAASVSGWCKVALIDAHPIAPRPLGAGPAARPGLIEYFERGEQPILPAARLGSTQVDIGTLSTAGRTVSQIESVRGLYATLRRTYSLIVVDCPPVFSGQQTLLLAPAANETILVFEAERTPVAETLRAREVLEQRGASMLGVVMNKSRRRIPNFLGKLL